MTVWIYVDTSKQVGAKPRATVAIRRLVESGLKLRAK
jgi:hypothetical protein